MSEFCFHILEYRVVLEFVFLTLNTALEMCLTTRRTFILMLDLCNDAFGVIVMQHLVLHHDLFTSIGVTVNAEMTTGVVHPNILTYHTSTYLALSFILEILPISGNLRYAPE